MKAGQYKDVPYAALALVRVQSGVDGVRRESIDLVLSRSGSGRAEIMNSFHFALNGVVSNHVFGEFDGAFVVVAPLLPVADRSGPPSGLSEADTWFHADERGEMRLPGAVLVAPADAVLPDSLQVGESVVRYEVGNVADIGASRDAAVGDVLRGMGVQQKTIGMHGWQDGSPFASAEDLRTLGAALGADEDLPGNHMHSIDGDFEGWEEELALAMDAVETGQLLHSLSDGSQIGFDEYAGQILSHSQAALLSVKNPNAARFFAAKVHRFTEMVGAIREHCDHYQMQEAARHLAPSAPPAGAKLAQDGTFVGPVVAVQNGFVIQSGGRGAFFAHRAIDFAVLPKVGDRLNREYRNGVALPEKSKVGQEASRDKNDGGRFIER